MYYQLRFIIYPRLNLEHLAIEWGHGMSEDFGDITSILFTAIAVLLRFAGYYFSRSITTYISLQTPSLNEYE